MSLNDIRTEAETGIETDETDGFGPDRALSVRDTDDVPLAPAPSSLEGKEFILSKNLSVPVWSFAAERFRRRIQADSPHSPRFDHPWANKARGKLLGAEECMRQWAETTVLLTYTGEAVLEGASRPMPPVSFTTALTASRPARRRAMRDLFGEIGGRWMSIRVIGSHESGYPHEHVLVGTEAEVCDDDFEPVMTAHREKSPISGEGQHGAGAIGIEPEPNKEEMTKAIQYLGKNLPGISAVLDAEELGQTSNGVLDQDEHVVRTGVVLEATGKQAFRIDRSDDVEKTWH